jgi:hypothetical protein
VRRQPFAACRRSAVRADAVTRGPPGLGRDHHGICSVLVVRCLTAIGWKRLQLGRRRRARCFAGVVASRLRLGKRMMVRPLSTRPRTWTSRAGRWSDSAPPWRRRERWREEPQADQRRISDEESDQSDTVPKREIAELLLRAGADLAHGVTAARRSCTSGRGRSGPGSRSRVPNRGAGAGRGRGAGASN